MDRASIFEARNYIPPPFNDYNGFFERWSAVTQIPVNELELQDTELWDITAKHPDKLQATLCRLYKANSPVRYMLLWTVAACILESQPQQYWDQLIDSGFPELLWEMSLDTKTYEGLAPNPAPAIREAKYCPSLVFSQLARIATRLNKMRGQAGFHHHPQLILFLEKSKELCNFLWAPKYREAIAYHSPPYSAFCGENGDVEQVQGLRQSLALLMHEVLVLHTHYYSLFPSISESRIAHILFYCWIFERDPQYASGPYVILLRYSQLDPPNFLGFCREAIVETDASQAFVERFVYGYVERMDAVDEDIFDYNKMMARVCSTHGLRPALADAERRYDYISAKVFATCKRQLCCGSEKYHSVNLVVAFDFLEFLLRDNRKISPHDKILYPSDLLPVVRSVMVRAIKTNEPTFTGVISRFLKAFQEDLKILTELYPEAGLLHKRRTIKCLLEIWQPTLTELRQIKAQDTSIQHKIVRQWLMFGHAFGFSDTPRVVPVADIDVGEYDRYERKKCHLSSCFCHKRAGAHHMRVCKGCWEVFYCSTKCQTADWKAGHNLKCRPTGS